MDESKPKEETTAERVTIAVEESKTGEIAAVCFLDGYRTALRDLALLAFSVTIAFVLARTFFEGEK
jgi:hypothetical protein